MSKPTIRFSFLRIRAFLTFTSLVSPLLRRFDGMDVISYKKNSRRAPGGDDDSPSDDVFPISQPSSSTVILFSGIDGSACSSPHLTEPYPAFLAQKTASTVGSIQYLRVSRGSCGDDFSPTLAGASGVILLILLLPLSVVSNLGMTLRESVEGLEIVVGDVYAMEIEASGSCALLSSSPRPESWEVAASSERVDSDPHVEPHVTGEGGCCGSLFQPLPCCTENSVEKVEEEAQRSSELKVQFGATETHLRGRYKYFSELEASGPALLAPLKNLSAS
ncbi:hypothetical protein DY000_02058572 [Brassica cretica]|uniref:Uncharacterized protein n=1 Tax=Brassica cretica TaxID=69181 RepID=A0ABQ7B363_BRACR|nr:hypothetical protein DY000_02058572 [Brassica cretica]